MMMGKKVALRNNCVLHSFVYPAQIIYNVIGVLRTIAFMGLKRNCPLNHDRLCRFLLGHISLTLLLVLLVSSLSRSPDLSDLTDGSQTYRRNRDASERFPRVPMYDRQFVCRGERTKADGTRRRGGGGEVLLPPSCRRAGLPSIPYVVRRLNETMR